MRNGSNSRRSRGRNNNSGRRNNNNGRSNTVYDSNGPNGRIRGTAQQVYDKYTAQAADAVASDDKVLSESMYQHAEHYLRVLLNDTDIDYETYRLEQENSEDDTNVTSDSSDERNRKTHQPRSSSDSRNTQANKKPNESKEKDRMIDPPGFLAQQPRSAQKQSTEEREMEAEPA